MTTQAEVTEFIDLQWEDDAETIAYWFEHEGGARAAVLQEWMSPEIAVILKKLVGDAEFVGRIARNGSNI